MDGFRSKKAHYEDRGFELPRYGIHIESHRHSPGFRTGMHTHHHTSLIYIVSGRGKCITPDKQYEVFANTAILLKKDRPHQLIDNPNKAMTVFVLYFTDRPALLNESIIQPLFDCRPLTIPLHYAVPIRRALRQMLHEQNIKPSRYEIAIQQCLALIMLNLYRISISRNGHDTKYFALNSSSRVKTVLDYVADVYYENHNLPEAAKAANLSQRQFTNICRKLKGKTFVQYLNSIRAEQAGELLKKTNMPVSAVAFEVGFEELSTFYRAFKKYQGVSPVSFRKNQTVGGPK